MDRSVRRRVAIVAIAAVVAATCVALGFWQLRRLEDRRAANAAIERALAGAPGRLTSGRADVAPPPYAPVLASGSFDPAREVLVYGRSLGGRSGHWLVTPLRFDDGSAVLVVRGWIPFEYQRAPVADAAPPDGDVSVTAFALPDEGDGSTVPDEDHVIGRLDVAGIGSALPYPVSARPIQLTEQPAGQAGDLPITIGPPELSEGPHLSYAVQWFSFAAIAIVGGAVLLRRERRSPTPPAS